MALQYNQLNISVNGAYILCDTLNLSESSPTKPIFSLGNKIVYDNTPTQIKNSISINYFVEPANEPNYTTITGTINDTTTPQPSIINVGNVFITGYLNSYSFALAPNGLIKASAAFEVYYPFTGNLIPQLSTDSLLYDVNNSSGLAHYWTAIFTSGNNTVSNNNVLQKDYAASISLTPIYGIGDILPKQIYINGIQENLNILSENQYNTQYSGQKIDTLIPSLQNLQLKNISSLWNNNLNVSIIFPITGFIQQECKSDLQLDNNVFFSMSFNRYH